MMHTKFFAASLLALLVGTATVPAIAAPAHHAHAASEAPPLTREDIGFRQQALTTAKQTCKYKLATLQSQLQNHGLTETQYAVEELKVRIEDAKLDEQMAKLRVDEGKVRVKEAQEYVLRCMDSVVAASHNVDTLQEDLRSRQQEAAQAR